MCLHRCNILRQRKDPLNSREALALKLSESLNAGNFSRVVELSFRWTPGKLHFHSLPTGVSLRRSFRRGQPRAGQCQLWSVCWCLYLPGSAVCRRDRRKRGQLAKTERKHRRQNPQQREVHAAPDLAAQSAKYWVNSCVIKTLCGSDDAEGQPAEHGIGGLKEILCVFILLELAAIGEKRSSVLIYGSNITHHASISL